MLMHCHAAVTQWHPLHYITALGGCYVRCLNTTFNKLVLGSKLQLSAGRAQIQCVAINQIELFAKQQ